LPDFFRFSFSRHGGADFPDSSLDKGGIEVDVFAVPVPAVDKKAGVDTRRGCPIKFLAGHGRRRNPLNG
jgi:hypothetical protein